MVTIINPGQTIIFQINLNMKFHKDIYPLHRNSVMIITGHKKIKKIKKPIIFTKIGNKKIKKNIEKYTIN